MKIYTDTPEGATVVQNSFIDQYMPHANGEYVKVYLYLLRCANTGRELSLSSIADVFEHTEKDVSRALAYWEKQNLLRLGLAADGTVVSVTFTDTAFSAPAASDRPEAAVSGTEKEKAESRGGSPVPTREQVSLREQGELKQLFFVAEQYLQRPLTSAEQSDFVYYYDTLHLSVDLIEYLLEYCISKGSASRHYMRRVALSWAEAGISTVTQAKQETTLYNKNYFAVLNAFGIKGRNPAAPEQEAMSRWFDEFGFTLDLVLEACTRTIQKTHQPNFQYADRILEQWHKNGVKNMTDVESLDRQRRKDQKKPAARPQKSQNNRFNNFSQREYDYSLLEKQLLNQ